MHSEHFYIKEKDAEKINNAKRSGHRVIAVGTTSCRVLESNSRNSMLAPVSFFPYNLAGITLVLFLTRQSPGSK